MRSGLLKFVLLIPLALYCGSYFYTGWHFVDTIDLSVHEIGHIVFGFFGKFVAVLGGSLFQLLLPVLAFGYFQTKGQRFSAAAVLMWLAVNLFYVGNYAADAITMDLPLVGFGDGVLHDWNYLLTTTELLPYTGAVARFFYFLGFLSIGAGLWCGWAAYIRDESSLYPSE